MHTTLPVRPPPPTPAQTRALDRSPIRLHRSQPIAQLEPWGLYFPLHSVNMPREYGVRTISTILRPPKGDRGSTVVGLIRSAGFWALRKGSNSDPPPPTNQSGDEEPSGNACAEVDDGEAVLRIAVVVVGDFLTHLQRKRTHRGRVGLGRVRYTSTTHIRILGGWRVEGRREGENLSIFLQKQ